MDMMEFLRTRRTYRRFEQRPVAPEILQECVDAARIASCGANRQTVMVSTLERIYNTVRQGAITTEITEIVGGAAALED